MRSLLLGAAIAAVVAALPAQVRASEAEDKATANRIAQYLKAGSGLRGYEIGVMCREGTAWLKGNVASAEQADMALELARQTEGVDYVVDLLTVQQSAPTPARPEAVQASIMRQSPGHEQLETSTANAPFTSSRLERRATNRPQRANLASSEIASPMSVQQAAPVAARSQTPQPYARTASAHMPGQYGQPIPAHVPGNAGARPISHDNPNLPGYAWPSYASHPNYGALTYPKQYSPTAWPYIGPFYPYPQVPLGWRKVTLEWDDGWWMLDFKD